MQRCQYLQWFNERQNANDKHWSYAWINQIHVAPKAEGNSLASRLCEGVHIIIQRKAIKQEQVRKAKCKE